MIKFPAHILLDIKKHLEEEKKKVTSQIADLVAQDPFTDTSRLSDNAASDTEANEETDHERFQAMILELKSKQEAIQMALDRIAKGTYGFCTNCKKLIDTDRLALIPTATLCIDCEAMKKK